MPDVAGADIETFRLESLPAELPFCSAVRAGDTVHVSGQIGNVPGEMRLVEGGIEAEARQAMEHMKAALELAGSSLDRVLKCTVYLADMADYRAFNGVYASYFPNRQPARSGLQVAGLALGARVEIECVALAG